jgi:hypothetical protein
MRSVQDLQIRYLHTEEDGIEELERVFKYLTHLRNLRIEAPCCNDTPWIERRNKPALAWKYGGKIDIAKIFELALSTHYARNIEPSVLFQLQSCMFVSGIPEPRLTSQLNAASAVSILRRLLSYSLSLIRDRYR